MPIRSCPPLELCAAVDRVLLISADPQDDTLLREVLSSFGYGLDVALDWASAKRELERGTFGVIVTERDLPDGEWRNVLCLLETISPQPPLIVVSRLADEYLWVEVLNRCGFNVLAKPFERDEVARVLSHAVSTWERMVTMTVPALSDGRRI